MKNASLCAILGFGLLLMGVTCAPAAPFGSSPAPSGTVSAPLASADTSPITPTRSATLIMITIQVQTPVPTASREPAKAPLRGAVQGAPPADVIFRAQNALLNVRAYRVKNTTTLASGQTSTQVIEFAQPDRLYILQPNGAEMIVIKDEGTWQKVNGTWEKMPVDIGESLFSFRDPEMLDELRSSIIGGQATLVGGDFIDEKAMTVYEYATVVKAAGPAKSDLRGMFKEWIGVADGLPYRQEGEVDSVQAPGQKNRIMTIYEYDPTINIDKPLP